MVVKNLETYLRKRMGSRSTLSGKDSQLEGILPNGESYRTSMCNLDEIKFLARVINYYLSDLGLVEKPLPTSSLATIRNSCTFDSSTKVM